MKKSPLRIACVYDWFDSWGGAERILHVVRDMYPHADWYTSWVHPSAAWAHPFHATTSFIQSLPVIRRSRLLSAALYPSAFESFDFDAYDVVLSITSSYAKGIITKPHTTHISYIFTPTRFLWSAHSSYLSKGTATLMNPYITYAKEWDLIASQRPDHLIAISQTVADRVHDTYGREADVLYPPLDRQYWEDMLRASQRPTTPVPQSFYLLVSRFKPYKKIDVAIKAFNKLPHEQLVIVGDGSFVDSVSLKAQAGQNITFIQKISDAELAFLYSHAKALIMPQEEDFGYTALEAQICGCAVIAYNKGGATETVVHNKTGFLFDEQTPEGIQNAIANFQKQAYTVERYLQAGAVKELAPFEKESFVNTLQDIIQKHSS